MSTRIGILLPRSVEYPSISFDLLDGLRIHLRQLGLNDVTVHTENTGFGEDPEATYAAAEKLVINHDVDFIIAYSTSLNAEQMYSFSTSTGKPILFLDAGMEHFDQQPHPNCYHLTLQGTQACYMQGEAAGSNFKNVMFACSFLDGGYRGNWFMNEAATKAGATVTGHFVSLYNSQDFSLAALEDIRRRTEGDAAVLTAFTSYLTGFFLTHLKDASPELKNTRFYCSPFFAEELQLDTSPFPDVDMSTIVPWARTIESAENQVFMDTIKKEKNKTANIFHLLGWESAMVVQQFIANGAASINAMSFSSPRGVVHFHPDTHSAYAPLYEGKIVAADNGNCRLILSKALEVTADAHHANHISKPVGDFSRWKNNFFCI
ncbi:MAG: ABC transporter substrate-binding protein [Bacteroidia bacterium]